MARIVEYGVREGIDLSVEISPSLYVTQTLFENISMRRLFHALTQTTGFPAARRIRQQFSRQLRSALSRWHFDETGATRRHRDYISTAYLARFPRTVCSFVWGSEASKKHQRRDDSLPSNLERVLQLFRACEISTTNTTIRSSWDRTGLGCQARDGATYLVVEEVRIRAIDGFREIWQFDFHPNQLCELEMVPRAVIWDKLGHVPKLLQSV
jgi:hypothetical protein